MGRRLGKSGEARRRAERDYEVFRRQKEAASNYASVWRRLLAGPDPLLLDLFSEEVGNETGVRPEPESAARFIRRQTGVAVATQSRSKRKRTPRGKVAWASTKGEADNPPSLTLRGETQTFKSGAEVLVAVFEKLASLDPDFCRRYSERHRGQVRRYVAKSPDLLYPRSARPASASHRLPGGWWLATHCSNPGKLTRIMKACEVAGLKFGRDVIVHIPVGSNGRGRRARHDLRGSVAVHDLGKDRSAEDNVWSQSARMTRPESVAAGRAVGAVFQQAFEEPEADQAQDDAREGRVTPPARPEPSQHSAQHRPGEAAAQRDAIPLRPVLRRPPARPLTHGAHVLPGSETMRSATTPRSRAEAGFGKPNVRLIHDSVGHA